MSAPDPEPRNWHQKPIVRGVILLLLPVIAVALYLISTRIVLRRSTTAPTFTPEPAAPSDP